MKNKKLLIAALAVIALTSCGGTTQTTSEKQKNITYQEKYGDFIWSKTEMPKSAYAEVANHGTVVNEEYDTYAYAYDAANGNEEKTTKITKKLQVYLPYGYDETKKYDIAYFMHGGGDDQDYWLTTRATYILPTLDNMMANGKCRDVIIVCPTFYSWVDGMDKEDTTYASFPTYFPKELENEIIPLIEAKYHTYSDLQVTEEAIIASRDHRAFCGLSMGSMTSHEVLCAAPDKFSYIGSYSGEMTKNEEDFGYQLIYNALHSEEFNKYKINYWYNQNGTMDMAHDPHETLSKHVLKDMSDKFVDGENYSWVDIKGGAHAFNVWWVGLYNSLQIFFPVAK